MGEAEYDAFVIRERLRVDAHRALSLGPTCEDMGRLYMLVGGADEIYRLGGGACAWLRCAAPGSEELWPIVSVGGAPIRESWPEFRNHVKSALRRAIESYNLGPPLLFRSSAPRAAQTAQALLASDSQMDLACRVAVSLSLREVALAPQRYAYLARETECFLDGCCEVGQSFSATSEELFARYREATGGSSARRFCRKEALVSDLCRQADCFRPARVDGRVVVRGLRLQVDKKPGPDSRPPSR
jgi:hypothetical protein